MPSRREAIEYFLERAGDPSAPRGPKKLTADQLVKHFDFVQVRIVPQSTTPRGAKSTTHAILERLRNAVPIEGMFHPELARLLHEATAELEQAHKDRCALSLAVLKSQDLFVASSVLDAVRRSVQVEDKDNGEL